MKFITYKTANLQRVGVLLEDESRFADLTGCGVAADIFEAIDVYMTKPDIVRAAVADAANHLALNAVQMLAPIPSPRRNIFCVGKNYTAHAMEFGTSGFDSSSTAGSEIPDMPIIFTKPPSSVIGPGDVIPRELDPYDSVDYEGELAVVIGKAGRVGADEDPMDYVFGFTVVNDVTSRELQKRHKQWVLGKGIDGFCPMGPVIVAKDSVADLGAVTIKTWVNGELRQSAALSQLIFDIPRLIKDIGRSISLQPGDIIATGTPEGVGIGFKPPRYLKKGDVVRVEASHIGAIENEVG
ncbi:fumarylacetoacetate hydrolase family protein [Alcaligenaceae bacterium]|nr:fumarylacetoacetate hydrolase family protein [Alcaligenaceae bacterium]